MIKARKTNTIMIIVIPITIPAIVPSDKPFGGTDIVVLSNIVISVVTSSGELDVYIIGTKFYTTHSLFFVSMYRIYLRLEF
jgi:hypothetical protein